MKLAIMQPYIFPYLGYFQLIHAVDKFVFYDDVNFIKGGWINRNKILLNRKESMFTVPLASPSPNKKIKEVYIHDGIYSQWYKKFEKSLIQSYSKTPFFRDIFPLVQQTFDCNSISIAELSKRSIKSVVEYLDLDVSFIESSDVYGNSILRAQERVLDICARENASIYINASGGVDLYDSDSFIENGRVLKFIYPELGEYQQFDSEFHPGLSMLDVLMFNGREKTINLISKYSLK